MNVTVEVAHRATDELLQGINHLLPQLSSSAPPLALSDLERLIEADAVTLLVATSDGSLVGTLTLVEFPIPTGVRTWIEDVIVDDRARGLGVGSALTIAALDLARSRGARTVDLTSRPSREAANALYQRLGFERRETNVYRFQLED